MAMTTFLLALVVYTSSQGSAVRVAIAHQPHLKAVSVIWKDNTVPAFRAGDVWTAILGVDLDADPGEQKAGSVLTFDDGRVERRELVIVVAAKKFPATQLKVAPKFVQLSDADGGRAARESKETDAIYARISTDLLPDQPFIVPIAGGSRRNFGERRFFNGEARAPHSGADLRAPTGTKVHATSRGRVALAKSLFFTGNTVILDHGLGIYSLYAHLSRIDVKSGELVQGGHVVGLAGATGRVTGAHLHWAMRVQGARVDPFSLLRLQ